MITHKIPSSWQNLQDQVCQVLNECGLAATVEQRIRTTRSCVNVDVYATEIVDGRKSIILCECKWWKKAISQEAINAFRTVVSDHGANKGYIISKNGFYPAAHLAADYTNIQLVDWETFIEEFEATWLDKFFIPTITEQFDWLIEYLYPNEPAWLHQLPENAQDKVHALKLRFAPLGVLAMMMSEHMKLAGENIPKLPLRTHLKSEITKNLPEEITSAFGYRELLVAMLKLGQIAHKEFHSIRDQFLART